MDNARHRHNENCSQWRQVEPQHVSRLLKDPGKGWPRGNIQKQVISGYILGKVQYEMSAFIL